MHILQLVRRLVADQWGGTETVIIETSKRLLALGHRTEVLCTMATAERSEEQIDGVEVRRFQHFYPFIGLSDEARQILDKKGGNPFSFRLVRAIKRLPELDIIHLHSGHRVGGIGRYVARKRSIPYIISLHGGVFDVPQDEAASFAVPARGAFEWGKALGWWVGSRRVLLDADAVLCVGYRESQIAQKQFPNKRVLYLPNGADTKRFAVGDGPSFRVKHKIPQDAKVLLTVARIDSQKNQMLPVELLPELLKIVPETHVLLVGNVTSVAYHERLLQSIERLELKSHVTIVPGIAAGSQELVDAYHAGDIFLLPSVHEPFGIVILEAWAAGLPVMASNVGGIPHFVESGKDGLLFDQRDVRSFLHAFRAIATDKSCSASIAENGRTKVRRDYDWNITTKRLASIYEEVIEDYSRRNSSTRP